MQVYRGEIYYVNSGIHTGSEQSGNRPCIIVGNNKGNRYSPVVEVVYTTCARKKPMETHVEIKSAIRPCIALCEQISTVSKERLGERIGMVTEKEITEIDKALLISLGIKKEETKVENIEQKYISSLEVAEMVEKRHDNLLADIRGYEEELSLLKNQESNSQFKIEPSDFFVANTYMNRGKEYPCYNVTKKGCEFIAHKLTGIKGTEFTAKYIHRFHAMEESIQKGFDISQLSPELQAIFAHDKKLQAVMEHMENHESRIDNLENTMTVDYGQQKRLNDTHHATAIGVLGGSVKMPAYQDKSVRDKVFRTIWKNYKDYFEVSSYRDTSTSRYDEAIEYLSNWLPDMNLKMEIQRKNQEAA